MHLSRLGMAVVLLTSVSLFTAAPVWSAETAGQSVKKVKAKSKIRKHARIAKKPVRANVQEPVVATVSKVTTAMPAIAAESAAAASTGNPYLSTRSVQVGNPYLPSPAAASAPVNPYLANSYLPKAQAAGDTHPEVTQAPSNQYVAKYSAAPSSSYATASPASSGSNLGGVSSFSIKDLLPSIPEGQSILPTIKKVYPTGEKPLVVLTFHCPTELIGITPAPTKLLHEGVNGLFDLVNATDVLSFNLQQVCQ